MAAEGTPRAAGFRHRYAGHHGEGALRFGARSREDGRWHVVLRQVPAARIPTEREYADLLAFRTGMRRFMQWSEERAQEEGMTHLQHQLLLAVRALSDHRGPTLGEIADHLLMTPSSASELVDRAETGGYVRRQRCGEDARVVRVQLTAVGEKKLERLTIDVLAELARVAPMLQLVLADVARG
jgi:DNA-binding MarR family transcriptional regulator